MVLIIVLARYGPKGKRYDTIDITQNIAIRYDTIRCINATSNLTHGRQFVNERLLLLRHRLRAWPVQQDDDRSETADTGTCADDLKRSVIGNVNRRQRDMGTGDNGDTAVVTHRSSAVRGRA